MRSNWCRCYGSCKSSWSWLSNRLKILTGVDRFRWQLLPKGYSQFSVHLWRSESTGSGCLLATSHWHEWISENEILTKGSVQMLQYPYDPSKSLSKYFPIFYRSSNVCSTLFRINGSQYSDLHLKRTLAIHVRHPQ